MQFKVELPGRSDAFRIEPAFPSWQESFVSGNESPLFSTRHFAYPNEKDFTLTEAEFKAKAMGPPGHVHGGATAALFDEVMGICVWRFAVIAVTQSLEVRYHLGIKLSTRARIATRVVAWSESKFEVHSSLYDEANGVRATARGIFSVLSEDKKALWQKT